MRLSFRALGLRAEGRAEEGLALIRADVRPNEGRSFEMMAKAQLLETLGGFAELATLCTQIRERAQRAGWAAGPAMADRLDAARLLTEGDAAGAAELARSSADRFAETGAEWEAAVSRLTLAEALHALGRAGDAAAALAEADSPARCQRFLCSPIVVVRAAVVRWCNSWTGLASHPRRGWPRCREAGLAVLPTGQRRSPRRPISVSYRDASERLR